MIMRLISYYIYDGESVLLPIVPTDITVFALVSQLSFHGSLLNKKHYLSENYVSFGSVMYVFGLMFFSGLLVLSILSEVNSGISNQKLMILAGLGSIASIIAYSLLLWKTSKYELRVEEG